MEAEAEMAASEPQRDPAPAPAPSKASEPESMPAAHVNMNVDLEGTGTPVKRRLSAPSADAVTKLVALREALDELDTELSALAHEYDTMAGPELQDPIVLGQLVDRVAKVGARGHATEPKVDAVATRSLVSLRRMLAHCVRARCTYRAL